MGFKGIFKKSLFILFYSVVIFSLVFALLPIGFIYAQGLAVLSINSPLTELEEDNLNGAVLTVTLTDETFVDDVIDANNIVLNNAPTGLTVGSVTWVDTNNIEVNLVFDGTDFDADISNFSITVAGSELASGNDLASNNINILAIIELNGGDGGWIKNPSNDHYYKLTTPMPWLEAEAQAVEWGGHLVTLRSWEEESWIKNVFGENEYFWIGFNDIAEEGNWVWSSGEPVTYTNWAEGEPNNTDGYYEGGYLEENAAVINWAHDPEQYGDAWNDLPIDGNLRGIVEVEEEVDSVNKVNALFQTSWNYIVPEDAFPGGEVTGGKQWHAILENSYDATGGPVTGLILTLDTTLEFDAFKKENLTTLNPPPYEWSYGSLGEGSSTYGGAYVAFMSTTPQPYPVTFTPGYSASRSVDKTVFSQSDEPQNQIQTLTIEVTPQEDRQDIQIGVFAYENELVNPVITSVTGEGDVCIITEGHDLRINLTEWSVGIPQTFTVTIQVTPKVPMIEFMPYVFIEEYFTSPISGPSIGSSLSHSVDNEAPEVGTWICSAEGSYNWYWTEKITHNVAWYPYSREIVNNPPVAQASIDPYQAPVGTVFTFDGSASYDENGTIVSYDWDFGDGTIGSGVLVTHTYAAPGHYDVVLTATDNMGAQSTYSLMAVVGEYFVDGIDVWSYADEFDIMIPLFNEIYPDIKVNFTKIPSGEIVSKLEAVFQTGVGIPDVFVGEQSWVKKWVAQDVWENLSASPYNAEVAAADHFSYVKDMVRDSDGNLRALSYQACPGGVFYRRSMAIEAFGTDDPAEISALMTNMDAFLEMGRTLKDKGIFLVPGVQDIQRFFFFNKTQPWVVDGNLVIEDIVMDYFDVAKTMRDEDLDAKLDMWSGEWTEGIDNDTIFSYIMPTWGLFFVLEPNAPQTSGDWAVAHGPASYAWGGTWLGISKTSEKKDLAWEFVKCVTTNKDFLRQYAEESGWDFTSDAVLDEEIAATTSNEFLGGQNHYEYFLEEAKKLSDSGWAARVTQYDEDIQNAFLTALGEYVNGNMTKDEAIESFKDSVAQLIINTPPVAEASIDPYLAPVGSVFTFDGSASYDEDGTIVSYDWDFEDGTNGSGETTAHVYTSAGTYTVTLTVMDNDGATDTDTAIVTVQTPKEATQDLITDIEELNLPGGIENSLTSKLGAAINSLNNGQENAAINKLNAFINQVKAQRGKKITDEQADELIAEAQKIIDNI